MKCPKCGFNSFEFLDACKKCGNSFDSFKKLYRINPVMFHSSPRVDAASREESPLSGPSPETAEAVTTQVFMNAPESSRRDVPGEASPPTRKDEPFDDSSFRFPEETPNESSDLAFGGFSSQDEPAAPAPSPVSETLSNASSIGDENDGGPAGLDWNSPTESFSSESDNFERLLDSESLGDTGAESGGKVSEGEDSYFGTSDFIFAPEEAAAEVPPKEEEPIFSNDFSFAAEQVTEDIFQSAEEHVAVKSSGKKTLEDLDTFEKEFEMIFASDEGDKTGNKN